MEQRAPKYPKLLCELSDSSRRSPVHFYVLSEYTSIEDLGSADHAQERDGGGTETKLQLF